MLTRCCIHSFLQFRRAKRSETVAELMAEIEGRPEEIRAGGPAGMDTIEALRTKQRMEARADMEEEMFARVSLTKDERKKLKAQRRAGLSGKGMLEDLAGDVVDLLGEETLLDEGRTSQKFGADLYNPNRKRSALTGNLPHTPLPSSIPFPPPLLCAASLFFVRLCPSPLPLWLSSILFTRIASPAHYVMRARLPQPPAAPGSMTVLWF